MRPASVWLAVWLAIAPLTAAWASPETSEDQGVFDAMAAEMGRSLRRIKDDGFGPSYFIAYRLICRTVFDADSSFGAMEAEGRSQEHSLYTEVRFGTKALDNSDPDFNGRSTTAPCESQALRQSLWMLTDAAYKDAIAGFLKKQAKRATDYVPQETPDFSTETPAVEVASAPPAGFEEEKARVLVNRLGAVFRRYPDIYDSDVSIHLESSRRYLLTSEGTRLATEESNAPDTLRLSATTRSQDGMRLDNYLSWAVNRLEDLPSDVQLEAAASDLAGQLERERAAPLQAPVAAPAILDPEFTGVLFHEAIGHKLEGQRQRDPEQSQVFKGMIGKPVIPPFLSLVDDPTMASFRGQALHGHYEFDSEGVRAQRVVLVDHGILRNFLMSRWPIQGFLRSNGHGRAEAPMRPVGRMANLMVQAESPATLKALKARLLRLIRKSGKPYGFVLVGAFGGDNPTSRQEAQTLEVQPRLVYRVDAKTGAEELVRGVRLVGTPLLVLNRIVAAADDETLANAFFCGAESGWVPVDQIAPSVLVSEIELQRLPEDRMRPPILPSPFHDRQNP